MSNRTKIPNNARCIWTYDYTGSGGVDLTPRETNYGTVGDAIRNRAWHAGGGRRPTVALLTGERLYLSDTARPYAYIYPSVRRDK